MAQIEDLSNQIMNSSFFQQMLKNEVEKYAKRLPQDSPYEPASQHMSDIIKEINGYLIQMTELALEQENSHNYIVFMKKTQQMCREIQTKIELKLLTKIEELSLQVQRLQIKLYQTKNNKRTGLESNELQQKRKIITQHILQSSRNIGRSQSNIDFSKNKSPNNSNHHLQMQNIKDQQIKNSIRLIQIQQSNSKQIINELQRKIQRSIERLAEQLIQLKKSHFILKQSLEGISTNFDGVWNVLSDLSTRIIKFQSCRQNFTIYKR